MSEPIFEVLSPEGSWHVPTAKFASPAPNLEGLTICELWDGLFRGDEIFALIRQGLRERFPRSRFVESSAFGTTHGPNEAEVIASLPALLQAKGCDVVISGVGG